MWWGTELLQVLLEVLMKAACCLFGCPGGADPEEWKRLLAMLGVACLGGIVVLVWAILV
jgi:hypothetical protein